MSHFVFHAGQNAELAFYAYVELMSIVADFLGEGYVLVEGQS